MFKLQYRRKGAIQREGSEPYMCKGFKKHVHVIHEEKQVFYSTTCPDCFSKMLNHPEILEQLNSKK